MLDVTFMPLGLFQYFYVTSCFILKITEFLQCEIYRNVHPVTKGKCKDNGREYALNIANLNNAHLVPLAIHLGVFLVNYAHVLCLHHQISKSSNDF